ncbi:sugar kinase [Gracilibacillus sp. HCP3S3_G5_1]|uniref:sugar kinase n=1 Tax=unclassified Gracilibacillus TaxID=2625209 RepID=UPI003F8B96FE
MDLITIGESMVLFIPDSTGPLRFAERFSRKIGGAESNVAIALARLGHKTGWISKLGHDEFGLYVRNFIRSEGVDVSQVTFDNELPTSVFFKERRPNSDPAIYYYRKNSAFSSISKQELDHEYIAKAKYLHLTGITPALSDSAQEAVFTMLKLAKENRQKIIFDPNVRLKLWSSKAAREVLVEIAKQSTIVMPGLEEGQLLTNKIIPEDIANDLLKYETEVVVIKLGEEGAFYATRNESAYVSGYKVRNIVDTVGAGDGFAAGFISGLLNGWSYSEAVKLGNRIGAYALEVEGDVEGYPLLDQIQSQGNKQLLR